MATKGINKRDISQFLNPEFATSIRNYTIDGSGKLRKRKGFSQLFTVAGSNPITMLKKFTSDIYLFAYATTLAAYTISTNTVTSIKTDFAASITDGVKYGDYFFTCNGVSGDKIYRTTAGPFATAEVTNAPKCVALYVFNSRLFAGNTNTDTTEVHACQQDDGTNPPFATWAVGTTATSPFKIRYRNAGAVKSLSSLGDQVIVLYEDGRAAFRITSLDVGGTLTLNTPVSFQQVDFGGFRGAVTTPKGVFYVNEGGLWQLISLGQTNVPYSENLVEASLLLGPEFLEDVNFSNADIAYDLKRHLVLVTCADDSSTNNLVIAYNVDLKNHVFFTGWNFSRLMADGEDVYGASASTTTVYTLFSGFDDAGTGIYHEYEQEIQINSPDRLSNILRMVMQCEVSTSSDINIRFDIFDRDGNRANNKKVLQFPTTGASTGAIGLGSIPLGGGASSLNGEDSGGTSLILSEARDSVVLYQVWRLILRITGNDKVPHVINLLSLEVEDRNDPIRLNNLTT